MGLYISLVNWTDQGIQNIKDSPGRLDGCRQLAKKYGCELTEFFMTIGAYDMVAMLKAPDDEFAAKFSLALASAGSVRTTTLKAFSEGLVPQDRRRPLTGSARRPARLPAGASPSRHAADRSAIGRRPFPPRPAKRPLHRLHA